MVDRWTKLSDAQMKAASCSSGLHFKTSTLANSNSSTRLSSGSGSSSSSMFEEALEEAERARKELVEENGGLKSVILASANELARTVHTARQKVEADDSEVSEAFNSCLLTINQYFITGNVLHHGRFVSSSALRVRKRQFQIIAFNAARHHHPPSDKSRRSTKHDSSFDAAVLLYIPELEGGGVRQQPRREDRRSVTTDTDIENC